MNFFKSSKSLKVRFPEFKETCISNNVLLRNTNIYYVYIKEYLLNTTSYYLLDMLKKKERENLRFSFPSFIFEF